MQKAEFLLKLKNGLSGLPHEDIDERLSFYEEMINDKIEEGMSEQDAVKELGTIDDIVSQTVSDIPLGKRVKEKIKPKRTLKAWEIVLIVLGSPVWVPVLISLFAVILFLYICMLAVAISLFAVDVSFLAVFLGCVASSVIFISVNRFMLAAVCFFAGLLFAGLTIFMFYGCIYVSKGLLIMIKKSGIRIKTKLVNRGDKI